MIRPISDFALDAALLRDWALALETGKAAAPWDRLEALRASGEIRLWAAASTLAAATSVPGPEAGPLRRRLAAEAGKTPGGLRLFTVDAASAARALASAPEGGPSCEAAMALESFRRACPEGFFLSRAAVPGAASPEDALAAHASRGAPASVPMLDLKEEYRLLQPALDRALLGAAARAQYILGPEVARFETSLASYLGTSHAVGVSNGTDSLVLALRALAMVRHGKERFAASDLVLTTPFTFVATGDAILRAGATPLFCDIDARSGNLDAASVRRALEHAPGKVVGMIPVHIFGRPCPMDDLLALAKAHGLFVLEDVAQAFGAAWKGRRLGSLGDISSFSFFPSKNLGGFGDAGGVATSDPALAETVSMLLKHGGKGKGTFDVLGYNMRLDTLQAAVLAEKLPGVEAANLARRAVAKAYIDALGSVAGLTMPEWAGEEPTSHVFHQFTLRCAERDALQAHLAKAGVASMIYYGHPLHKMKLFAGRCAVAEAAPGAGLPESEKAAGEVLSLPIGPSQGAAATAAVIAAVEGFFGA